MRKLLTLFGILFSIQTILYSQSFSIPQLIKMTNYNPTQIDRVFSGTKWSIEDVSEENVTLGYITVNKNNNNLERITFNEPLSEIVWTSYNFQYYSNLYNQIKDLNFKEEFDNESYVLNDGSIVKWYTKGNVKITILKSSSN